MPALEEDGVSGLIPAHHALGPAAFAFHADGFSWRRDGTSGFCKFAGKSVRTFSVIFWSWFDWISLMDRIIWMLRNT